MDVQLQRELYTSQLLLSSVRYFQSKPADQTYQQLIWVLAAAAKEKHNQGDAIVMVYIGDSIKISASQYSYHDIEICLPPPATRWRPRDRESRASIFAWHCAKAADGSMCVCVTVRAILFLGVK